MTNDPIQRSPLFRPAIGTAIVLAIPLVMTFVDRDRADGDGWHWGPRSFAAMGALLFGAGLAYEVLASRLARRASRSALAFAISFLVFAIWVELAVGGVGKAVVFLFR